MWVLYAFLSAFFAGIMAILAKIGIRDMDSNLATAIRTLVVVVLSWGIVFLFPAEQTLATIDSKSLLFLVLSGLATGASWLCYFKALQLGSVNQVTPVDKSSVLLTMILSFLFLGEPLSLLKVLALFSIGIGTYLMIDFKSDEADTKKNQQASWFIYASFSAFFASLTAILGKIGIENVPSNLGTAIRTLVILGIAWVIVFAQKKHRDLPLIAKRNWYYLFLSGLATGLSWLCYYRALQDGPASVVVPIDKLSIVMTIFFSYFILGEKLRKKAWLGLILLVGGTLLLLV